MKVDTFIFNWRNQYDKTVRKIKQFNAIKINPLVINSDDNHIEVNWLNIGEESYFTAQMLTALDHFKGDIFFHIQADASYYDWEKLIEDAKLYFKKYKCGIYAPNIDYTWYDSSKTDLDNFQFPEKHLKMVANTDCTCWFIHRDIIQNAIDRKINFAPYKMGWSFDIIYSALSFLLKRPVIRDYNHTISHPQGTNYNIEQAEKEMQELFNTLSDDVKEVFYYIKMNRLALSKYYQ